MGKRVPVMLQEMSAGELAEFWVYHGISPSTEERADRRIGQLAALIANLLGNKLKAEDFDLDRKPPKPKETVQELHERVAIFAMASGARIGETNGQG